MSQPKDWTRLMSTATTTRATLTIELVVIDSTKGTIGLTLRNQYMELQTVTLHSVRPQDRMPLVMPDATVEAILDETGYVSYVILPDGSQYAAYDARTTP